MAEHVFESDIVEEFYNSCHGPNGRFCSAGAKGKGIKRVPMSDAARASNAAIRGKAARARKKMAAKQEQSKGAMAKMSGQAKKVKAKEYGSGKTEPEALKMTQKYGTRGAGAGVKVKSSASAAARLTAPKTGTGRGTSKPGADNYGSGKTDPAALNLTKRFGTASGVAKATQQRQKAKELETTRPTAKALSITERYGSRRRGN